MAQKLLLKETGSDMEYIVIEESSIKSLQKKVTQKLTEGFELVGGVACGKSAIMSSPVYVQALLKKS